MIGDDRAKQFNKNLAFYTCCYLQVHTPDGSPCGLLNHLTLSVKVATHQSVSSAIPQLLIDLGMCPLENSQMILELGKPLYHVLLNGKVLGYVLKKDSRQLADKLRMLKVSTTDSRVPELTEICLIPEKNRGQFPDLFIFTGAARMLRPVFNLAAKTVEYIGTLEQVYMDIAIR